MTTWEAPNLSGMDSVRSVAEASMTGAGARVVPIN